MNAPLKTVTTVIILLLVGPAEVVAQSNVSAVDDSKETQRIPDYFGKFAGGGKAGRYIRDGEGRSKHHVDGDGLAVAVFATSIPDSVPALKGRVLPQISVFGDSEAEAAFIHPYGAQVASIIAGYSDEYTGGVAAGASILPVEVISSSGSGSTAGCLKGVEDFMSAVPVYEREHDVLVSVAFLAFGTPHNQGAPGFEHVAKKLRDQGIFVVAPSGNIHLPEPGDASGMKEGVPASCSSVFSVGAISDVNLRKVNQRVSAYGIPLNETGVGQLAPFSRWGPPSPENRLGTGLFAPGVAVAAMNADGHIVRMNGTGPAAASVAGAAVLIQAKCRELVLTIFDSDAEGLDEHFRVPSANWLPPVTLVEEFLRASSRNVAIDNPNGGDAFVFKALDVSASLDAVERKYNEDLGVFRNGFGDSVLGCRILLSDKELDK